MKNLTPFLFLLITFSFFAQSPEKMSYQAVIRDATNTLLTNQSVGMQISILQTTTTGTAVYIETQTVTTNTNGLVSLEIGMGDTSDDFSAIDWKAGPYFVKTETDPTGGSSYTITGTSQLMSVPFALYAKSSGSSETNATNIANNTTSIELNTLKVGITAQQASDITSNNAKTGITSDQATAITDNTAKTGITSAQATAIGVNAADIVEVQADARMAQDEANMASMTAYDAQMDARMAQDEANMASMIAYDAQMDARMAQDEANMASMIAYDAQYTASTNTTAIAVVQTQIDDLSSSSSVTTYTVNTFYAELGGFVIEVRDDGKHGLVVAMQDQDVSTWFPIDNLLNDATKHDTDGAKFMDWRLPTIRELELIYLAKANISPMYGGNDYWSSTQPNSANAYFINMANGFGTSSNNPGANQTKNELKAVRAVRTF